ncbi:MAG TPA: hypothetical protein VFP69_09345, partial [Streptomyces sp.]|nr:hypothetical protein [Streptomyces sp.]
PHPPYPATPHPPQPGPYAPQPAPGPYPPQYAAAPYAPHPQYAPPAPLVMPGTVRAARVVVFVMAGLGVLLTALVAGTSGAEAAGRFFSLFLMTIPLFVLAFRYGTGGNGVRVASIVLASLQLLLALGTMGRGVPSGLLPFAGALTLLFLLASHPAGAWFRRNSGVVPPQAPYGPYGA